MNPKTHCVGTRRKNLSLKSGATQQQARMFDSRVSNTFEWVKQLSSSRQNHETVLKRFERDYDQLSSNIDPDADPVNILCIGGGGMKGKLAFI